LKFKANNVKKTPHFLWGKVKPSKTLNVSVPPVAGLKASSFLALIQ
jgi:hypothetical protein